MIRDITKSNDLIVVKATKIHLFYENIFLTANTIGSTFGRYFINILVFFCQILFITMITGISIPCKILLYMFCIVSISEHFPIILPSYITPVLFYASWTGKTIFSVNLFRSIQSHVSDALMEIKPNMSVSKILLCFGILV